MTRGTFLELMDKYIDGELSQRELQDFELLLQEDLDMKNELKLHTKSRNAIIAAARADKLRELNMLKKAALPTLKQERKSTFTLKNILPYAAAASVLLVSFFWLFNENNNSSQLIYTSQVEIEMRPKEGMLGAAPSKSITVQVYCCSEKQELVKEDSIWRLNITDKISDTELDSLIHEILQND